MSKLKKTDEIYNLKRQLKERDELIVKLYRKLNNELKEEKKLAKKSKKKEPIEVPKPDFDCPECHEGKLTIINLGIKITHVCPVCKYRKTMKNG